MLVRFHLGSRNGKCLVNPRWFTQSAKTTSYVSLAKAGWMITPSSAFHSRSWHSNHLMDKTFRWTVASSSKMEIEIWKKKKQDIRHQLEVALCFFFIFKACLKVIILWFRPRLFQPSLEPNIIIHLLRIWHTWRGFSLNLHRQKLTFSPKQMGLGDHLPHVWSIWHNKMRKHAYTT